MPDDLYRHRDVLDKLGIKPGQRVALDHTESALDEALVQGVLNRVGSHEPASDGEAVDLVLAAVEPSTDAAGLLIAWRVRLQPAGATWLLSRKRGQEGYVDQRRLIQAGLEARMVDNKVCSVSETTSAIRFVIRRRDR
ncbi:MAG: DUF3052 family protein [Chloroflexota bacterium]|nr:MAG: hypothetical protein DLM70_16460 [Chloroflexota bacterium]